MSQSTKALIEGLQKMLENRGSMTVEEEQLLSEVIKYLEVHDELDGDKKVKSGVLIVQLLLRFMFDPKIGETLAHLISHLIDKLL